jgi:histidyl-tRNA synthetase
MGTELQAEALNIAQELRAAGINTALYLEDDKFDKQMKYAEKAGIPLLVIFGAQEKSKGEVAVKNLKTGDKKNIARSALTREIVGV